MSINARLGKLTLYQLSYARVDASQGVAGRQSLCGRRSDFNQTRWTALSMTVAHWTGR
jgi:hypothetical protein